MLKRDISITRYMYRGSYRADISIGDKHRVVDKIPLSSNESYLFVAEKSTMRKYRGEHVYTEIIYKGRGYLANYKDREYILIPLYPRIPKLDKNILRVSRNKDYGEAHFSLENNILKIRTYYIQDRSRALKIILNPSSRLTRYGLGDIIIYSVSQSGDSEYQLELPVLNEPHLLILPNSDRFLEDSELLLSDIVFTGKPLDRKLILGFKDTIIKLVLDTPHSRDVTSKDYVVLG